MGFDYRTSTGMEKQTIGRHKQTIGRHRSQEKEVVSLQETEPDMPVGVRESLVKTWVDSGLLWGQGH